MVFKQLTLQDALRGGSLSERKKREREGSGSEDPAASVSVSKQKTKRHFELELESPVEENEKEKENGCNKENLSPAASLDKKKDADLEKTTVKTEKKQTSEAVEREREGKGEGEDKGAEDSARHGERQEEETKTEVKVKVEREREKERESARAEGEATLPKSVVSVVDPHGARLLRAYSTFYEDVLLSKCSRSDRFGKERSSRLDRSRFQCVHLLERGILQRCLKLPKEEDPLVGMRVRVHWPLDDAWYAGEIESRCERKTTSLTERKDEVEGDEDEDEVPLEATEKEEEKELADAIYRVRYEDNSVEELNLRQETVRLEVPPMQPLANWLFRFRSSPTEEKREREAKAEQVEEPREKKEEKGIMDIDMDSLLSKQKGMTEIEIERGRGRERGREKEREACGAAMTSAQVVFGARDVLEQGNVVWAKMKGYPPWPALVITPEEALVSSPEVFKAGSSLSEKMQKVCFRFFGAYNHGATQRPREESLQKEIDPHSILNANEKPDKHKISSRPYDMWDWRVGVKLQFHLKYKLAAFKRAVAEAERYLVESEMPDAMIPAYHDNALLDDEEDEDDDTLDTIGRSRSSKKGAKGRKGEKKGFKTCVEFLRSFKVGKYLRVEDIGSIEAEDERFHDERFVYPLGFQSVRTVQRPSGEDMEVSCSITRYDKALGGGPAFTVTATSVAGMMTDDAKFDKMEMKGDPSKDNLVLSFTERSAQKAWQRLADVGCIKRQVYSGHKLFGYSILKVQKVIERLPGVEWCHLYSPLDEERWKKTILRKMEDQAKAKEEKILQMRRMWHAIGQCPKSLGFDPVMITNQQPNCCAVCNSVKDTDFNELIQCDSCKVLVHAGCYGIEEKHDGTSVWRCSVCALVGNDHSKEDSRPGFDVLSRPACALCPCVSRFQAMKPTEDNTYAHVTCAIWIPETHMSPRSEICGVKKIRPARLALKCDICKVQRGPCIQCSDKKCFASAHPLCARAKGWEMKILEDDESGGVTLKAFCLKHSNQPKGSSNTTKRLVKAASSAPEERQMLTPKQGDFEDVEAGGERTVLPPRLENTQQTNRFFCARTWPYQGVNHLEGSSDGHVPMRTKSSSNTSIPYLVTGASQVNRLHLRDNFKLGLGNLAPNSLVPPTSSVKDRLEWTRQTTHVRLAAGRSSIHGWGAFTRLCHYPGDFIIEYVGEVISLEMANQREKDYSKSVVGIGTYMFAASNKSVIDATAAGNMAHLINHSCDPNCFSRVVLCEGKYRVVISALREIQPGEELTYDYRFSGDETLICHCGSDKCRGTVNINNTNEEEEDTLL